ncbi:hypothetical protein CVT26_013482 [Gymnopilus dilepis]|uniref:Uncharacterized protein n=1 Tax=Gymnopilus dilepis TaxID=231916 RepID=A0A409YWU1_9AGAR|nr:hypothetical protein CVT26_013482 [Gymnopilus dilepis]
MAAAERSQSRGREPFHSTGRGGLGNIRQSSVSRDARSNPSGVGPDDFSIARGREPVPHQHQNQVYSTGRGGAGNLRSPSRDPATRAEHAEADAAEQEVIREYVAAHEGAVHSSGRGGLGNMNRSRSRDPGTTPNHFYSTGRGGAGNIHHGEGIQHTAENLDEEERIKLHHAHSGLHSTGRGGAANITSTPEPSVEHPSHDHLTPQEFESTGRGGLGNMVRERSSSRQRP